MYWLRTYFVDYCKNNGVQILRDDLRYIERLLRDIPYELHKSIMWGYLEKWHEGMGCTDKVSQKQNLGRKTANLWLSEECSKHGR